MEQTNDKGALSYIKDQYDIDFVLEDSMKCCDMWRELGLLCFNVWFNNY